MHYFPHNIADYRKDTIHLSLLEHGIYRQLLDSYYLNEKPIETQMVIRRLQIITQNELDALNAVLNDFFTPSECGNFWNHIRCDAEIAKYKSNAEISRINGRKGGRPKKPRKTQQVNLANPDITQTKPNQEPITNNQEPIKEARFKEPTLKDITDAIADNNYNVNPNNFFNHYKSNGWKVGKNKMKSWKHALAGWNARDNESKPLKNKTDADLMKLAESLKITTDGKNRYQLIDAIQAKQ